MSKFGLKCFVTSFIFSLVGVIALIRTHSFWQETSLQEGNNDNQINVEAKNIELFTVNEENDPIYEKYAQISASETKEDTQSTEPTKDVTSTTEIQTASNEDILYMPDETAASIESITDSKNEDTDIGNSLRDDEKNIAFSIKSEENEQELQIADAAAATEFKIPLIHNYAQNKHSVSVSSEAKSNQIAMASNSVNITNLGTDNEKTAQSKEIEENDNPWVVAEVANKNITRNKSETAFASQSPDEDKSAETQVAYKMQKNILIPIPEDIMNEKNLTPQISSSEENKKLEEELRRKKNLENEKNIEKIEPNGATSDNGSESSNNEDAAEDEIINSEDTSSLTDSIAAWFSRGKNKKERTFFSTDSEKEKENDNESATKKSSTGGQSSLFRKLLGLSSIADNGDITPTELKLSFQPDRAEISGQTLEWLHAFSDNVVNNEDVKIEIRIDKSAPFELQQKRLKLLYRILANNGVGPNKVDMIFTDREPNSFIIRNVHYEHVEKTNKTKLGDNPW